MSFPFKKTRLIDLRKTELRAFQSVKDNATRPYPRLNGNPRRDDGWSSIGCPIEWLSSHRGFENFLADIGTRKRLVSEYTHFERLNLNESWSAQNVTVRLKPEYRQEVIKVIQEEIQKSSDLAVILSQLTARNVPSENGRPFREPTLRQFILENKVKKPEAQTL